MNPALYQTVLRNVIHSASVKIECTFLIVLVTFLEPWDFILEVYYNRVSWVSKLQKRQFCLRLCGYLNVSVEIADGKQIEVIDDVTQRSVVTVTKKTVGSIFHTSIYMSIVCHTLGSIS